MDEDLFSGESYLRAVLDAFPSPTFIVDRDRQIHDANSAAREVLEGGSDLTLRRLCGDLMHCIHARQSTDGCGTSDHCPDCVLRQTVEAVQDGGKSFRRMSRMLLERRGKAQLDWFLVSGSAFTFEGQDLVIVTLEEVTEIVELRRIIPVCSFCHKARDGNDYWQEVEKYLRKYTGVQFSHGVCPDCARLHYPELDVYGETETQAEG